jgi:hypothetical protein
MAIRAVCECGKKFEAKDEYEGRRAICPSCKREFVFQRAGIPIFQEVLELPPPLPTRVDDDDGQCLPEPTPGPVPTRPFWKDPIVVIGAAVPAAILAVFFVYLYFEHKTKEFHRHVYELKLEIDDLVKSGQSRDAFDRCEEMLVLIGDTTKNDDKMRGYADVVRKTKDRLSVAVVKEIAREEAARQAKEQADRRAEAARLAAKARAALIPEEKMPFYAEQFAQLNIATAVKRSEKTDTYSITAVSVARHDSGTRKIPWLWEATANVAVREKADGTVAPARLSMSWRFLFQLTPKLEGKECWREVTTPYTGDVGRVHFETSEWQKSYREEINLAWSDAFPKFTNSTKDLGPDQRKEYLVEFKEEISRKYDLTPIELQEILEATD